MFLLVVVVRQCAMPTVFDGSQTLCEASTQNVLCWNQNRQVLQEDGTEQICVVHFFCPIKPLALHSIVWETVYMCMHACIRTCLCMHVPAFMCVCMCTCACMCARARWLSALEVQVSRASVSFAHQVLSNGQSWDEDRNFKTYFLAATIR